MLATMFISRFESESESRKLRQRTRPERKLSSLESSQGAAARSFFFARELLQCHSSVRRAKWEQESVRRKRVQASSS